MTRAELRHVRAFLRKCTPVGQGRGSKPRLWLRADDKGMDLVMHSPQVIAIYHRDGAFATDSMIVPPEVFDDVEGKDGSEVTLASKGDGAVQVHWLDMAVPRVKDYPSSPGP